MKVIVIIFSLLLSAYAKSENVKNIKLDENRAKNYVNITRLEDILNLFNINKIGASWKELSSRVNHKCSRDMTDYLEGLDKRKIWALKSKKN